MDKVEVIFLKSFLWKPKPWEMSDLLPSYLKAGLKPEALVGSMTGSLVEDKMIATATEQQ